MDDNTANRINERVDENTRDIGKIWGSIRELAVECHGINGDNGIRGAVRELQAWREIKDRTDQTLKEKLTHYMDVERRESCLGLAEFAARDDRAKKVEEEVVDVKVAKIEAGSKSWVQFLQLAGILIVALIGLFK